MELGRDALTTGLILMVPLIGGTLLVGILVSLFQAVTQINEMTLTFVPKILVVAAVAALLGPWMMNVLLGYATQLFNFMPQMVR
jgi:flagellar biosynthetic protein FliQ